MRSWSIPKGHLDGRAGTCHNERRKRKTVSAVLIAVLIAASLAAASIADPKPGSEASAATRALAARLKKAGRGEVRFERSAHDPFSGQWVTHRGSLTLEPPDRVMLHFSSTGERLALRADGGEWLQPELEQMLRLEPRHLAVARLWWGFLLSREDAQVKIRQVAPRRYRLVAESEASAGDTASVWLGGDGLPARLEFRDDSGTQVRFQFGDWKFGSARGRKAYVLAAPAGIEVVNLP